MDGSKKKNLQLLIHMTSDNKITLIIPDLHHRHEMAERIIKHVGADEVIFLGDLFDNFNDTPAMVESSARWLKWSVNQPNRIHIFGNHDYQYAYDYKKLRCSGYEGWKYNIIRDIVSTNTWNKIKWWYFLDNTWLLTHAGLTSYNLPFTSHGTREEFYKNINTYLEEELIKAFRKIANGELTWIFGAGHARYGSFPYGGITWCDFIHEFQPIGGLHQIFGHTPLSQEAVWATIDNSSGYPQRYPSSMFTSTDFNNIDNSYNLCLDVHGNISWATWNNKTKDITINNYAEL